MGELRAFANEQAKTAAALAQAVKLAEDGLIDVSDIAEAARRLKAEGNVKLSAADELFGLSPGAVLAGTPTVPDAKLDVLTRTLRELSSPG